MSTIISDPNAGLNLIKKSREKSISYALIDLAKAGSLNGSKFLGINQESEKCVFEKGTTQFEISPFAFCQRKETNVAQPPTYEFSEGALKGISIGLDPVVTVVQWLFNTTANTLNFRASAAKTVSIWNKTKGEWILRPNTTDLVIEVQTPTTTTPHFGI